MIVVGALAVFGPPAGAGEPPPDNTPPNIIIQTPTQNAQFQHGQVVNANYNCTDPGGSGVASCTGTVADDTPISTTGLGPKTFTVNAEDLEGNTSSTTRNYTVIDTQPPTVTINSPTQSAVYVRNQIVPASYSCSDNPGGSGITFCNGTVPNGSPINTSTLGPKTFTVNTQDQGGNFVSAVRNYTVVDNTDPTITITTPPQGATYTHGTHCDCHVCIMRGFI